MTADTPLRIRQALATHRTLTIALHARYNPVLDRLIREQDLLDGYSTTASGADTGPPGNSMTSSTEATGIARLEGSRFAPPPTAALDEGLDLALAAATILRLLHAWCDTHGEQLTATDLNRLRCCNWRADDRNSCGNISSPRRHNGTTIDDGRCLDCGALADELGDQRQAESNERRARRYATSPIDRNHT